MATTLAPEAADLRPDPTGRSRSGDERARAPKATLGPRPELPFVPGFAGLRAVALLAVLAFHQGFEFARGGFLGISTFFTLSGFLVTTIALAEWARNGSFGLARFWQHRAQRLVPAFAVTMLAVVVLQATLRVGAGPEYRGDVLAALGQVLNWRYAFEGAGFARIVAGSPVQHLWAISILAQLTLVLALVFVGFMKLTGRRWRGAGGAFALLGVASFAAAWFAARRDGNDGMAYFGTHTRAGEALVGVVLAYAMLSPRVRRLAGSPTGSAALRFGAPIALLALGALWVSTGLYSPGLFGGILVANALLTAWVVFAVTLPGPATTVLGSVPLRLLGGISYAAFLVHWPLYLLLDQDRIGLEGVPLFAVRLAATLAAGAALTYAVERPLRSRLHLRPAGTAVACVAVLAVLAGAAVALPELPPRGVSLTIDDGSGPGELDVVVPSGDDSLSIALVGGSLAGSLPPGFETWNDDTTDQQVRLATHVAADCPLTGAGPVDLAGRTVGDDVDCIGFGPRLPRLLDAADADVVLVVPSDADLGERAIDNEPVHLGDDAYDTWAQHRFESLASTLARTGAPVVWATVPHVHLVPGGDIDGDWTDVPANDPARVDRLNDIVRSVAADAGQEVVDLAAWAQRLPRGEFGTGQRADGRDLTEDGATRAAEWLVPQLAEVTATGDAGDGDSGA
jgi:peptidoglycan/LPS O-acetylase OafA/YrhL